jgi:hypothetical protein
LAADELKEVVRAAVGSLRAEIEGFLKTVAV